MKPIFTIHAGEYLVAAEIEKTLKEVTVWLPSKDTGIDLLLAYKSNKKRTDGNAYSERRCFGCKNVSLFQRTG